MNKIDLGAIEYTYSLNFHSHYKDVIEFTGASWMLTEHFFKSIKVKDDLNPKQKSCLLLLGKGQRLLRTIYFLTNYGYWPEAEILHRTIFETQLLLSYILKDKTDSRAKAWLSRKNPKERWPMSELLKDIKPLGAHYTNLSLYPHNHILSVSRYIEFKENKFSIKSGPLGGENNNANARNILGMAAMINASLSEIAVREFEMDGLWDDEHKKIYETDYYKEKYEASVSELTPEKLQVIRDALGIKE